MERIIQDLKYALRTLRQQPAFTLAAIAALALGIGATTAVFSVVDAILLRPFPYPDPGRIVLFMNTSPNGSGPGASPAKFAHWSRQTAVVQDAAAFRNVTVNFTSGDVPEQLTSGNVTGNFFKLWARGRFSDERSAGRRISPPARRSRFSRMDGGCAGSAAMGRSSARR